MGSGRPQGQAGLRARPARPPDQAAERQGADPRPRVEPHGLPRAAPAGQGRRHHRRRHRARRAAAQDPNTVITSAKAITAEPYGLGFNKADVYLVRYVNRVLADLVADGEWKAIYNRWLAEPIGPAPAPPSPRLRALMTAAPQSTPDQPGVAAPTAPGALGVPVQAAEAQTLPRRAAPVGRPAPRRPR